MAVPLAVIALAAAAVLGLWPLTPSVDSAPTLVNDILSAHGGRHLSTLPVPDHVGQAVSSVFQVGHSSPEVCDACRGLPGAGWGGGSATARG